MAILDSIAAMQPNAMETFTPPGMGGDADLAAARRRIPPNICMIGGFDQQHFFKGCTPERDAGRSPPLLRRGRAGTAPTSSARQTISSRPSRNWSRPLPTRRRSAFTKRPTATGLRDGGRRLRGKRKDEMRFVMKMPDLATTDSDIRIVRWMAPTGQKVERGQPLLEVETDKATMEVESVVSGVLGETLCQAGETVSVGQAIANLEVAGTASETTATSPVKIAGAAHARAGAPVASQLSATTAGVAVGMFARNRAAAAFPAAAKAAIPLSVAQAQSRPSGCRRASRRYRTSTCKPASTPRP